jgi:hypothetical protein
MEISWVHGVGMVQREAKNYLDTELEIVYFCVRSMFSV